jgi:hypothetical protein
MGLFGGKDKGGSGYEKSGSKGEPGRGYGKGDVRSNPKKYEERTEAQRKRSEKLADKSG